MKLSTHFGFIVVVAAAAVVAGKKFLAEKPDFLTPCLQTEPEFNTCLAKNFQSIFSEWKDGIPGLKTVGSIDPLFLKSIKIAEEGHGPVSLNLELRTIVIEGFSRIVVENAKYDDDKLEIMLHLRVPRMDLISDFDVKGRALNLPLNGRGQTQMVCQNIKLDVRIQVKLRDEGGFTFTDVEKLRVSFKDISGFYVLFMNLFNGDRNLEDAAHTLINDNWREFFPTLRPAITQAIEAVMSDRFRKAFAYVPAKYFIGDIRSAA